MGSLLKRIFDISSEETSFEKREFRGGSAAVRARLEQVGASFTAGYRAALEDARPALLVPKLAAIPREWAGFAYEGAAMGLALQDWLTPWRRWRVDELLHGAGDAHAYLIHVGAGWFLARAPGRVEKFLRRFDPLLRWLLVDGYGFHEGFFHHAKYLGHRGALAPRRLEGYARRAFDQGLGRCLWFIEGTEVDRIVRTLALLGQERHADLWSGLGLASVYAGETSVSELRRLREAAGPFQPALAQGAAFAAKARIRGGNATPYQDMACGELCGLSAIEAAQVTDEAGENLPSHGGSPSYEIWRRRIQQRFTRRPEVMR